MAETTSSSAKASFFWLPPLLAIAVCAALFYPSLSGGFVHTDENMIFGSIAQHRQSAADPYSLTPGGGDQSSGPEWTPYKPPAAAAVYNFTLGTIGKSPFVFHIVSLAMQLGCSLAMFFLLIRFYPAGQNPGARAALIPAAGVLLLALHPVVASSTMWISAQKDLISALFLMLSLLLFLHDAVKSSQSVTLSYAFSVLLYMLACTADARAFPWIIVIAAVSIMHGGSGFKERGGRTLKLLPFAAACVYSAIVYFKNGAFEFPTFVHSLCEAGRYTIDTLFPVNLPPVLIGSSPARGGATLAVTGAVSLAGAALLLAVPLLKKKAGSIPIAAAWFLASILPHMFEARDYMTDHRSYMAAAALVFALVSTLQHSHGARRAIMPAITAAAAALFLFGFTQQVHCFSSGAAFWARVADTYPAEADVWYLKAIGDASSARYDLAQTDLHKAISINPHKDEYHLALAYILIKFRKYDKVETAFESALKMNPKSAAIAKAYAKAEFVIGLSLVRENKPSEALGHFVKAIRINPRNEFFHTALATVLFDGKRYMEAYTEMAIASRLAPDNKDIAIATQKVLDAAKADGYQLNTEGVTDDFFRNLEKLEEAEGE